MVAVLPTSIVNSLCDRPKGATGWVTRTVRMTLSPVALSVTLTVVAPTSLAVTVMDSPLSTHVTTLEPASRV